MELDDPLCLCFHVTKRKVLSYLRVEKPRRDSQLAQCFGAGTGCGWCRPFLRRLFRQWLAEHDPQKLAELDAAAESAATGDAALSESAVEPDAGQYAELRRQYVADGHGRPPGGEPV